MSKVACKIGFMCKIVGSFEKTYEKINITSGNLQPKVWNNNDKEIRNSIRISKWKELDAAAVKR